MDPILQTRLFPKNIAHYYIYSFVNFYDQMIYESKNAFKNVLYLVGNYLL